MAQIRSLAVEPQSVETPTWRSTRYKHWIEGFIVDGDYWLVKVNKRTFMRYTEYIWNELIPPFPVPVGEGVPTLVNPDNPFYIWKKKPEQWHLCWFQWEGAKLTIVDMVTNEVIGHGLHPRGKAMVYSSPGVLPDDPDYPEDCWEYERIQSVNFFRAFGQEVTDLSMPSKERILQEIPLHQYYHGIAHGDQHVAEISLSPRVQLSTTEVGAVMSEPFLFAFADHCDAMDSFEPGTWAPTLSGNKRGHFVTGLRYVGHYGDAFKYVIEWKDRLFNYVKQGKGWVDAFEEALNDVPEVTPIVDIFEGSEEVSYWADITEVAVQSWAIAGEQVNISIKVRNITNYAFRIGVAVSAGTAFTYLTPILTQSGATTTFATNFIMPNNSVVVTIRSYMVIANVYGIDDWYQDDVVTREVSLAVEEYTLTMGVEPSGSGYTIPAIGNYTYRKGTPIQFSAHPYSGYEFDQWFVRIGTSQESYPYSSGEVLMDADTALIAFFKAIEVVVKYTLGTSVNPSGSGYIIPSSGTYDKGSNVTLTAYPYSGYELDYWKDEVGHTFRTQSIQIIMDKDRYLVAYFRQKVEEEYYTLTVTIIPSGSGTVEPSGGTFKKGQVVTITAYPALGGVLFDHWEGTDDNYINPTTVTMDYDKHVIANFVLEEEKPPDWASMLAPVMLIGMMGFIIAGAKRMF